MDYSRPDLVDRLAAEYVLGTLDGAARRRFEALQLADPNLRHAVAQWQGRLAPLSVSVSEVATPERVWHAIEDRLFSTAPVARPSLWQRLALWRTISALATAAAVGMFMVAIQAPTPQAPVIVVLDPSPDSAQALNARFVASISADGRTLVLRPLIDLPLSAGRALELWAVPAQGAPRSLGLVRSASETTILRTRLLQDTAAFAVSVEPAGGSPTGAPTGPIVAVGKLQI